MRFWPLFWALGFFGLSCLAQEAQVGLEILEPKPNPQEVPAVNEVPVVAQEAPAHIEAKVDPGPGLGSGVEPQEDIIPVENEQPIAENIPQNPEIVKHEPEEELSGNGFVVVLLFVVLIGAVCFCHSRLRRSRSRPVVHKGIRNVIGRQDGNYVEMSSEV